MATRSAQWWPSEVPGRLLVQGGHPLPGEGLGEPDAVTAGLADVGVVHEAKARGFAESCTCRHTNPRANADFDADGRSGSQASMVTRSSDAASDSMT